MGDLLKERLVLYIFVTVFLVPAGLSVIITTFAKTKEAGNIILKTVMRIGVSGAFVWFVVWHIICMNLFPISLAYLEYKNELTDEYVGVIQHIDQRDKERIYITIDDTEFIIAHNLTEPIFEVGKDFDRGNTVKIEFGEKSKFVFNIYEQSDLS